MLVNRSYIVNGGRNVTVRSDANVEPRCTYGLTLRSGDQRVPSGPIAGCIEVSPPNGTTQARTYWWAHDDGMAPRRFTTLMKAAQYLAMRYVERARVWGTS